MASAFSVARLARTIERRALAIPAFPPDAPRLFFAVLPVAWLCNVTHDVFGEHPKDIYIHTIE